jgi:hypothetical protein
MSYGVYLFFASFTILSIFFVYVSLKMYTHPVCVPSLIALNCSTLIYFVQAILPETRQVPLERINELFAPGVKPWQAHGVVISKTREEKMHHGTTSAYTNRPHAQEARV